MDGIFEIEGILSENDCDRITETYNENFKYSHPGGLGSATGRRVDTHIKATTDIYLPISGVISTLPAAQIIRHACVRASERYVKHFQEQGIDRGRHDTPSILEDIISNCEYSLPQIQKVTRDGFFNWHSDCKETGEIAQFIFYLTDDFEGGRTEFSNGRVIEPKKGKVLIIPCTPQHIHRGNKVVGDKVKFIASVYMKV